MNYVINIDLFYILFIFIDKTVIIIRFNKVAQKLVFREEALNWL